MIDLQAEWTRLCAALGVETDYGDQLWAHLVDAYGEPQRHYHTLDHIAAVTGEAVRLRDRFTRPDAAVLALFSTTSSTSRSAATMKRAAPTSCRPGSAAGSTPT